MHPFRAPNNPSTWESTSPPPIKSHPQFHIPSNDSLCRPAVLSLIQGLQRCRRCASGARGRSSPKALLCLPPRPATDQLALPAGLGQGRDPDGPMQKTASASPPHLGAGGSTGPGPGRPEPPPGSETGGWGQATGPRAESPGARRSGQKVERGAASVGKSLWAGLNEASISAAAAAAAG